MRVAGIVPESSVDGPGIRFVLFVQGCEAHCPGCHNPETWNRDGGIYMSIPEVLARLEENDWVRRVTFSGGEPFLQAEELAELASILKARGMHLMAYSGQIYETLCRQEACLRLLRQLDLLVDGPYCQERRSLELRFRGSDNQRVIDVPASLASGHVRLSRYHDAERGA